MRYGYNTNGLAHHRLDEALGLLAAVGYDGVALTPDVGHLDPYRATSGDVEGVRARLEGLGLACVVETGARYLLDPRRKHRPNLLSDEGWERRVDFLERCIVLARDLGAPVVSLWSGAAEEGADPERAFDRLVERLEPICDAAARAGVTLGFEPEPGMLVDTLEGWDALRARLPHPALGLTLDVGHVLCEPAGDPVEAIRERGGQLVNVQLDDMPRGIHEHRPFGEGDLDLPGVLAALAAVGWDGLCGVELSRDSHRAHTMVPRALAALRAAETVT